MLKACVWLIVATPIWLTSSVVLADTLLPTFGPTLRVFASERGRFWVRISQPNWPQAATPRIELMTSDSATGGEQQVWQADVPYTPDRVVVSDYGAVILLDQRGRRGYDHAVVLVGSGGNVMADYSLDALLKDKEIKSHTLKTVGSRTWLTDARFDFTKDTLSIRLNWKKVITVDLLSGKLIGPR